MQERRLVVTMACGGNARPYSEVTFPLIQSYAKRCNADFHVIYQEDKSFPHVGYQKWSYIELLPVYDRILHVDADMIVRSTTPDLFDLVDPGTFGAVNELPFQDLNKECPAMDRVKDMELLGELQHKSFYANVGLYLFDHEHKDLFNSVRFDSPCYFKEQSHINYNINKYNFKTTALSFNFNYMKLMENAGLPKSEAHIIHYAGGFGGHSQTEVLELMKKDIL